VWLLPEEERPLKNAVNDARVVAHALRDVGWLDHYSMGRAASRWRQEPTYVNNLYGFRCAK
jgi:formylglycine-generating enzyme required for sulfatase activity